jgi:hypothetical protein
MLKNIRWTDFLIIVFFLTATYYLVVVLLFYRGRIRGMFRKGRQYKPKNNNGTDPAGDHEPEKGNTASLQMDDFTATKEASDKLKIVISRAISDGVDRQDLLDAISVHLQSYKRFEGTAFGIAIRNSVARELSHAGYTLSEEEPDAIWSSR